jgi:hypothetical protein
MKDIKNFILESINDNVQKIQYKLSNSQDMIIEVSFGHNEEQKLSKIAKKSGYADVITVYTDQMQPDDFKPVNNDAVPQWALPILDNKNKKYLLVFAFDNIDNKLMNAAMTLFVKHEVMGEKVKNMNWCIATKNINDIPKPVLSRAGGVRDIIKL